MADNEIKVENSGSFTYYSIETPGGNRWTFEDEDLNEGYIEDTLWAWSRLLDFVKDRNAS